MKRLVRLKREICAEGHTLPAGTVCEVECAYEESRTLDLVAMETGVLLWEFEMWVEDADPTLKPEPTLIRNHYIYLLTLINFVKGNPDREFQLMEEIGIFGMEQLKDAEEALRALIAKPE